MRSSDRIVWIGRLWVRRRESVRSWDNQKSSDAYNPANLPPARIVDNPPAKTVAQALANSKRQVDATR